MLELEASVTNRRNIFAAGRELRIEAVFSPSLDASEPIVISEVLEKLLTYAPGLMSLVDVEATPENGQTKRLVRNVRGRPAESFRLSTPLHAPQEKEPREEELFFSEGSLFNPPANLEDYPTQIAALQGAPFQYRITTHFHSFNENGQIVHERRDSRTSSLESIEAGLSPRKISRLFPAKLNQVRLGFESYRSRAWGSWLGLIPRIDARLYLEITRERIYLFAEDTAASTKGQFPFEEIGFFTALDRTLQETLLFSGLTERLKAKL